MSRDCQWIYSSKHITHAKIFYVNNLFQGSNVADGLRPELLQHHICLTTYSHPSCGRGSTWGVIWIRHSSNPGYPTKKKIIFFGKGKLEGTFQQYKNIFNIYHNKTAFNFEKFVIYRPKICVCSIFTWRRQDKFECWYQYSNNIYTGNILYCNFYISNRDTLLFVICDTVKLLAGCPQNAIDCGNWTNNLVRIYIPNQHMNQWPTHQWEWRTIQSKCRCANTRKVVSTTTIKDNWYVWTSFPNKYSVN